MKFSSCHCFIIGIFVLAISLLLFMGSGFVSHELRPDAPLGLRNTESTQSRSDIDTNLLIAETAGDRKPNLALTDGESKSQETPATEPNSLLGTQKSKFAYITLIHGIDNTFTYRGFLYNALIMRKSLTSLGSTADFIVMLGFTTQGDQLDFPLFEKDIQLLEDAGIRILYLPRLLPIHKKVKFTEMALLKIAPWNLTSYDKIQYMDGDVLPITLMDCYFDFELNTFNTGNASPLNSGWFVAIPDAEYYDKMLEKAVERINNPWNKKRGWGTVMPRGVKYRSGKKTVKNWDFNGASLDQGLLFDTYALHGRALLLDANYGLEYTEGDMKRVDLDKLLHGCNGVSPIDSFIHYTGKKKPWLQDLDKSKVFYKKRFILQCVHFDGGKFQHRFIYQNSFLSYDMPLLIPLKVWNII
jgi:hypothetical protein